MSKKDRQKGLLGFHEIRYEGSSLLLSEYFFSYQEEATSGYNPSIREWILLFDDFGIDEGSLFCINLIKEGNGFNSMVGYEYLKEKVESGRDIAKYSNELKKIALTSRDPLKRTWAKILLKSQDHVKNHPKRLKENRSLFRVLLDVESFLHENISVKENEKKENN